MGPHTGTDLAATEILIFSVGDGRFGIRAADAIEVVRAVLIAPLPKAPPIVEGAINLRGVVTPVLDIRKRFNLPPKPLEPADHLLVARARQRIVALRVDQVHDLVRVGQDDLAQAAELSSVGGHVAGIAKLPDGLVVIHDLATFLSRAESDALEAAGA